MVAGEDEEEENVTSDVVSTQEDDLHSQEESEESTTVYVSIHACVYAHESLLYIHTLSMRASTYMNPCVTYTCIYVRMCCVLIRQPIPYITSSRCKRLHKFRPVEILLQKRNNTRTPLVTT